MNERGEEREAPYIVVEVPWGSIDPRNISPLILI